MAERDGVDDGTGTADETKATSLDRRKLLTRGALAAGVAGAVWAAPKVEGLSLRPDYAAAATNNPNQPGAFVFNQPLNQNIGGTGGTNQLLPVFGGPANVTWNWNGFSVSANANLPANCTFTSWSVINRFSQDDGGGAVSEAINSPGPAGASATSNYNDDAIGGTASLTITCT
ncbi:MAG: hypothetical protein U0Q07_02730 [Acidimicrobiales bacterium]